MHLKRKGKLVNEIRGGFNVNESSQTPAGKPPFLGSLIATIFPIPLFIPEWSETFVTINWLIAPPANGFRT